jgi:hypothetical protein
MPIRSTPYSFRFPGPDSIEQGKGLTLYVEARTGGAIATPTVAGSTCTVYDGNGDVVKTGAIVIADGYATFALLAGDTSALSLGMGWRVEWVLVMPDGRTYTASNPAALVRRALHPVLSDLDLTDRYADLDRYLSPSETSWQGQITTAWQEIARRLFLDAKRPWLIMEPSALLDVHRDLTLALIFADIGSTQRSTERDWRQMAADHRAAYEAGWKRLSFTYDESDTGAQASAPRRSASPIIVLGAPGALYRRF